MHEKRMVKDRFYDRLERVNGKIEGKKPDKPHGYAILIVILGVVISSLLFLGLKETGYVVFEEDTIHNTDSPFFISETRTIKVKPPIENPKSLWLSGEVFGEGKVEVYLVTEERMYLVYYFEGEAHEGKVFSDMCIETCFNQQLGEEAKLYFKLKGMRVRVDNIKYVSSRLVEFELLPKEVVVTESSIVDVRLTNSQSRDLDIFLYVDGPLADSFSWQGSLVHLDASEKEKVIPVKIVLPDGLAPGEYPNKITARYVPPGDKEFVGSSPVDEMIVMVVK